MMNKLGCLVALVVVVSGCASDDANEPCAGLAEAEVYSCLTEEFWQALQVRTSLEERSEVYDYMGEALDDVSDPILSSERGHVRFHRGQLAMAIALENESQIFIERSVSEMNRALEDDPANLLYPTWIDSMEVALAATFEDWDRLEEIKEQVRTNALREPEGNVPSISGTTIGLPLSTGYPQMTIELFEDHYPCVDKAWCQPYSDRAPYAMPGMNYHWAEQYIRVGDRERALHYLEQARAAEMYSQWPYREIAETAYQDIDGAIAEWAALGEEGSGLLMSYANQTYGCQFCHTTEGAL